MPDSSDDVQDVGIADGATPPPGEKIPGENSFYLCKGDRSNDAVCIEPRLLQFSLLYLGKIWSLPEQGSALILLTDSRSRSLRLTSFPTHQ